MIQWILASCSLVPLPFLNLLLVWKSKTKTFIFVKYCKQSMGKKILCCIWYTNIYIYIFHFWATKLLPMPKFLKKFLLFKVLSLSIIIYPVPPLICICLGKLHNTCNMLHREQRVTAGSSCRTWDSQDDWDSLGQVGPQSLVLSPPCMLLWASGWWFWSTPSQKTNIPLAWMCCWVASSMLSLMVPRVALDLRTLGMWLGVQQKKKKTDYKASKWVIR